MTGRGRGGLQLVLVVSGRVNGKSEPEHAAMSQFARYSYLSAVIEYGMFHDCQTQSGAAGFA
jgi:hypothetical protein